MRSALDLVRSNLFESSFATNLLIYSNRHSLTIILPLCVQNEDKFVEGIFMAEMQSVTNGVKYVNIVLEWYPYNAIGEDVDLDAGRIAGPVVVCPIYSALWEEIKYRTKHNLGKFHCITGTPGIGKSFFAPILARFIMEYDENAIVAYWRAKNLFIFSKKAWKI